MGFCYILKIQMTFIGWKFLSNVSICWQNFIEKFKKSNENFPLMQFPLAFLI